MLEEINGDKCYEVLDQNKYIFFYFGAEWCGPCKQMQPKITELSKQYDSEKIIFYKIDIDKTENNNICNSCQIKVIPAFLLFNGRNFIDRKKGNNLQEVENMINTRLYPPIQTTNIPTMNTQSQNMLTTQPQNMLTTQSQSDPYEENKKIFNKDNLF